VRINSFWPGLRRAARWHRRELAACAAAICVLATISALSPPPAPTQQVLVASTTLTAGATLGTQAVELAEVPVDLVPEGALESLDAVSGKVLAGAVSRGSIVTRADLLSSDTSPGEGELLVPFRLADAGLATLVQSGDRVTVVTAGADGAVVVLARRARIVTVRSAAASSGLGVTSGDDGVLVVVSVDETTAGKLATWAARSELGIALG